MHKHTSQGQIRHSLCRSSCLLPDDSPGRTVRELCWTNQEFSSRLPLMPTQSPIHWIPWVLSPGVKRGRGVTLTTHYHLAHNSRMSKGCIGAVPWLRRLVSGHSPRGPGFAPGSIHVRFMVDKVALGQVFLWVLRFSPVDIIPPSFSILIYHLGDEQ
jgi:hypothetical protein